MSNSIEQWIDTDDLRRLAEGLLAEPSSERALADEVPLGDDFVGFASEKSPGNEWEEESTEPRSGAREVLREASERAARSGILRSGPGNRPHGGVAEPVPRRQENEQTIHPEKVVQTAPGPFTNLEQRPQAPRVDSPFRIVSQPAAGAPREPSVQSRAGVAGGPSVEPVPMLCSSREAPLPKRLQAFGAWLERAVSARAYMLCDRHGELLLDTVGNKKLLQVARTLGHASSRASRQTGGGQKPTGMQVRIGPTALMEVLPLPSPYGLMVLALILDKALSTELSAHARHGLDAVLERR